MGRLRNDKINIELRKQMRLLLVSGLAMIAFAVWSLTKTFINMILDENIREAFRQSESEGVSLFSLFKLALFLAVIALFVIVLHLIAGIGACRRGRGKKTGFLYLAADYLIGAGSAYSILRFFLDFKLKTAAESLLPDVSLLIISVVIIVSSRLTGKLQRQLTGERGGAE